MVLVSSRRVITRRDVSSPSIVPEGHVPATSLADLLAVLQACELPERKRQELCSAVRTVARALGRSPQDIAGNWSHLATQCRRRSGIETSTCGHPFIATCARRQARTVE